MVEKMWIMKVQFCFTVVVGTDIIEKEITVNVILVILTRICIYKNCLIDFIQTHQF